MGRKDHPKTEFERKVLSQLEAETNGTRGGWWDTRMADVLIEIARAGPLVVALSGIAAVLRDGEDPDIVTGGTSPEAAFEVAHEWVDAASTRPRCAAGCGRAAGRRRPPGG